MDKGRKLCIVPVPPELLAAFVAYQLPCGLTASAGMVDDVIREYSKSRHGAHRPKATLLSGAHEKTRRYRALNNTIRNIQGIPE